MHNKRVHSDRAGADWRTQFKRHPMLLIGIALGAGMALSRPTAENITSRRETCCDGLKQLRFAPGNCEVPCQILP